MPSPPPPGPDLEVHAAQVQGGEGPEPGLAQRVAAGLLEVGVEEVQHAAHQLAAGVKAVEAGVAQEVAGVGGRHSREQHAMREERVAAKHLLRLEPLLDAVLRGAAQQVGAL